MGMQGEEDTADDEVINHKRFLKPAAWVERFGDAYEKAVKQHGKPEILSIEETKEVKKG